jgi:hypothetical protein
MRCRSVVPAAAIWSKGQRLACSLAACVFVLTSGLPLSSDTTEGVPFQLKQRHLVVTKGSIGRLNGLNLLIDTGTIPSVVARRVARQLRLQTRPSTLVAFGQLVPIKGALLEGFRIGPLWSGAVPACVGDLSYLEGVHIDAIVGLDVLVRTSFAIDYRSRVLTFAPVVRADATAPLEVTWPFITVRLTAAAHQVRLLIDTGSPDLVLFKTRLATILPNHQQWRGDKTVRYASGPARLRRIVLRDVTLGANAWSTLPAWALDRPPAGYPPGIDGVLGVTALGCRTVHFDFERSKLGCSH